jgi:CBS domain-containing protein
VFLDLIVGQQVEDAAHGIPPSNTVSVKRLAARDRERLRVALGAVAFAGELARDMLFRD